MSGELENVVKVLPVAMELYGAATDLINAARAGDAEAERQAILRANRATSDELARREASE